MKKSGPWIALCGLVLAIVLFQREGFGSIADLLYTGSYGLVLAACFHVVPMTLNARAWQSLTGPAPRTGLPVLVLANWLRESVNGLLPVARIGGELAAYRLLIRRGAGHVPVAASLIVDLVLSMLSQSFFTLFGLVLLMRLGVESRVAWQFALGFVTLFVIGIALVLFQRSNATARILRTLDRALAGRLSRFIVHSERLERGIQGIYERRGVLLSCFAWQLAGWVAGAGEILVATIVLGRPVSIEQALLIEASIQTISSIGFIVPGALGIQEGGFLLIGMALGLDGPTSLALAAARRLRDIVVFFPGLMAWTWLESRHRRGDGVATT